MLEDDVGPLLSGGSMCRCQMIGPLQHRARARTAAGDQATEPDGRDLQDASLVCAERLDLPWASLVTIRGMACLQPFALPVY